MKKFPIKALLIGSIFCIAFNYIAIVAANRGSYMVLPSTQISSWSFAFIILLAVLINPLLKAVKLKPLLRTEIILIAVMAIVPAGLAVFGFTNEFIPLAGTLNNPEVSEKYEKHVAKNVRQEFYINYDSEKITEADEGKHPADTRVWDDYNKGLRVKDNPENPESRVDAFPIFVPKDDKILEYPKDLAKYFFQGNPDNRSFWGDVHWGVWLGPIIAWCMFLAIVVLLFYALNELLFKQWYENEKLVFPHGELINNLAGVGEEEGRIPKLYKSGAFWAGFSVSFLLMLYNGLVNAEWIEGITAINLDNNMRDYLINTKLQGLNPAFRLHVFFVVIGLAFLLPAEISFSIWFFFLLAKAQQLLAISMGYGENARSFSGNWTIESSRTTSQGGGAMIVFSIFCLWKVRDRLFIILYDICGMNRNTDTDTTEQPTEKTSFVRSIFRRPSEEDLKSHRKASYLFFAASLLFIGFFYWAGVSMLMCLVIYVMVVILAITTVRMVSEGGLIGFQIWYGPFHVLKNTGLITNIKSLAAAVPIYSSALLDIKTFIAPTMMTAKDIAHRAGIRNAMFPIAMFIAIAVSMVVSISMSLILAYDMGLISMNGWFFGFNGFPKYVFGVVNDIASNVDIHGQAKVDQLNWAGAGMIGMGGILWLRTMFFWVPHPIGLLMLTNPIVHAYWFSFLLAWAFKICAVKYCKPASYQNAKYAFMGLFIGELIVVALSAIGVFFDFNMGISLNRNG